MIRRVFFHLEKATVVGLPQLLEPDGSPCDLTVAAVIQLITRRDDHSTEETATLGVSAASGTTAGALALSDGPNGYLTLTVDPTYFTTRIPAYGVVYVDGRDYPQDGFIQFEPRKL